MTNPQPTRPPVPGAPSAALAAASLAFALLPGLAVAQYQYSLDIGSDFDLSDSFGPTAPTTDAGDVYVEGGPAPILINDDTGPTGVTGFPFGLAPQPAPGDLGVGGAPGVYAGHFDMDGLDKLGIRIDPTGQVIPVGTLGDPAARYSLYGLAHRPPSLALSFDDDTASGWAAPSFGFPSTPTGEFPDFDTGAAGPFDIVPEVETVSVGTMWPSPGYDTLTAPAGGRRDEIAVGVPPGPTTGADLFYDDDVDALNDLEHRFVYFSADHEGHLGVLDPGAIYVYDSGAAGVSPPALVADELLIGGTIGVDFIDGVVLPAIPPDADLDAFEFVTLTGQDLLAIYEAIATLNGGPLPFPLVDEDADYLALAFSIDDDDPDTPGGLAPTDFFGDESGGLKPDVVYMSDLAGTYWTASLSYRTLLGDSFIDIDAITIPVIVPEPRAVAGWFALVAAVAPLAGRRRR